MELHISPILHKIILAGVVSALAGITCAETVVDGKGFYYHLCVDGSSAELTFLATDSTNATAYIGDIEVPETIIHNGQWLPVTGVTALACAECDQLNTLTLPEGVTSLGLGAFSDCPNLQQVTLPASLQSMQDLTFYRDSSLVLVDLPEKVRRIGASTFAYCMQLDSIGLQYGLRCIATRACYYCPTLRSVRIPGSVSAIGEYAFAYCTGLEQIVMEDGPIAVTPDVFEGVDVSSCRLVVPTSQLDAYREADVWCDFQIVDGGEADLPEVEWLDGFDAFSFEVIGSELILTVDGDAPALVYDLSGRRIAVAGSHSGENRIPLARGRNYIIRCGRTAKVITL